MQYCLLLARDRTVAYRVVCMLGSISGPKLEDPRRSGRYAARTPNTEPRQGGGMPSIMSIPQDTPNITAYMLRYVASGIDVRLGGKLKGDSTAE